MTAEAPATKDPFEKFRDAIGELLTSQNDEALYVLDWVLTVHAMDAEDRRVFTYHSSPGPIVLMGMAEMTKRYAEDSLIFEYDLEDGDDEDE